MIVKQLTRKIASLKLEQKPSLSTSKSAIQTMLETAKLVPEMLNKSALKNMIQVKQFYEVV